MEVVPLPHRPRILHEHQHCGEVEVAGGTSPPEGVELEARAGVRQSPSEEGLAKEAEGQATGVGLTHLVAAAGCRKEAVVEEGQLPWWVEAC